MKEIIETNFAIGQVVRHKFLDFRGVIFDVDPEFNNTEEWYQSIPAQIRPKKDQPFYHVFAENEDVFYTAYVSQQNLLADISNEPVSHPDVSSNFGPFKDNSYEILQGVRNYPAKQTAVTNKSIAFFKSEFFTCVGASLIFWFSGSFL